MNIPVVFLLFLLALVPDGTVSDDVPPISQESGPSVVQQSAEPIQIPAPDQPITLKLEPPILPLPEKPIQAPVPEAVQATPSESKPSVPAENPPVIAIPVDWLNNVFYSIIGLLLLAGIAWLFLQWKKLPKIDQLENKDLISQTSQNVGCQKTH